MKFPIKHSAIYLLSSLVIVTAIYAQNTFPLSGNVGIGTASPVLSLTVTGYPGFAVVSGDAAPRPGSLRLATNTGNSSIIEMGLLDACPYGGWIQASNGGCYGDYPITLNPSGGNVGIGTTNPGAKLDVNGAILTARLYIGDAGPIDGIHKGQIYTDANNALNIYAYDAGGIIFRAAGGGAAPGEQMRIASNGNVGIGTAEPTGKLTFDTLAGTGLDVFRSDADAQFAAIRFRNSSNSTTHAQVGWNGDQLRIEATNSINLVTNGVDDVRIDSSGNVGIGTTSPTEKLSVNGRIRAKEVIVETTGWSDHVLAKSYKLASLSEVEQHIDQQGHLPGVPSAQEVAEKGVSLGDMQAILLAKIEEVTLHQIAQEKELASHRSQIQFQAAEIAVLKAENAALKAQVK